MTVTEGINIKFNLLRFVIPTERFKSIIPTFLYNPTLVARVYRLRRLRVAALLPSMEKIHGLQMMSVVLAKSTRSAEIVARYGA